MNIFWLITVILTSLTITSWWFKVWFPNSLPLLLGVYLGFLLNLVAQNLIKANLGISLVDDTQNTIGSNGKCRWKFLHVKVTNKMRRRLVDILLGSKMALFCRAKVKFIDPQTNAELFVVDGRWSSTGEPIQIVLPDVRVFDYSKVPALRFEHILPGESSNLAIAVKVEDDEQFYGFSNYSYAFEYFRNDEWELAKGTYPVRVEVFAGNGERVVKEFIAINPNKTLKSFKLREKV